MLDAPIRDVMRTPVDTIAASAPLAEAERRMSHLSVSALPVLDGDRLAGVIARTDLLRAGRTAFAGDGRRVLTLPEGRVAEWMTPECASVSPDETIAACVRRMMHDRIHRLYAVEDERLAGVLGTVELLEVIVIGRIRTPVAALAKPAITVEMSDPVGRAVDRLAGAGTHALVVLDEGWPAGVFSQADALASRDAPPDDPVRHWMDPWFVCVPLQAPAHLAAAQALSTRAHRIVAVDAGGVRAAAGGLDLARCLTDVNLRESVRSGPS